MSSLLESPSERSITIPSRSYTGQILPGHPSSLFRRKLEECGLAELVAPISAHDPLTREQISHLLRAPIPLLLRLLECREDRVPAVLGDVLKPIFLLPVSETLGSADRNTAEAALLALTRKALESTPAGVPLVIAVDSWLAPDEQLLTSSSPVLSTLSLLSRELGDDVRILGPSTGELKELFDVTEPDDEGSLAALFSILRAANIDSLEGGADFRIHRAAINSGFRIAFAHNLIRARALREQREAFCDSLFDVRTELFATGTPETWIPWSSSPLDKGIPKNDSPLGFEMLFAIALARVCLPEVRRIRAPLSTVGPRMAELALIFGANDLGFAAIDQHSAEQLGLIRWQTAEQEIQLPKGLVRGIRFDAMVSEEV